VESRRATASNMGPQLGVARGREKRGGVGADSKLEARQRTGAGDPLFGC
jgi:hypothetical protein